MSQELTWTKINDFHDAPSTCGVYQYWSSDKLLYIGKAINLKARLTSHAQNAKLDEKERAIVGGATHISYTEVDSEFKCLLLEAKLIRENMPPYNRIWKDDKTYLYIVINMSDPFPRPYFARAHDIESTLHSTLSTKHLNLYGPFPSTRIAEEVLRVIRRLIPFCMTKRVGKHSCFYSKIGLCNPCPGNILKITSPFSDLESKRYRKQIKQVAKILDGKIEPVINDLKTDMQSASDSQDFEKALELRTKIERFTRFISTHTFRSAEPLSYNASELKIHALYSLLSSHFSHLTSLNRIECYDASNNSMQDSTVSLVVTTDGLLDRGQYRRFKIKNPNAVSDFDRLGEAIERRLKNKTWPRPDLIVIDGGAPQLRRIRPLFDQMEDPIPLIGLVKHPDHLVIPQGIEFINIRVSQDNLGLHLLQQLRDEAHRFANNYRKLLESKRTNQAIDRHRL
jgi:excinuclease ABC subunit C